MPLLWEKFKGALASRFDQKKLKPIVALFEDAEKLDATPADEFMSLLAE